MTSVKPLLPLALTMGEPAGIGPELIIRLWEERESLNLPPFIYIGAPEALQAVKPDIAYTIIADPNEAIAVFPNALPVLPVPLAHSVVPGEGNAENGLAVIQAIDVACELALARKVAAIVTAPLHKALLYKAGFDAPGHTEYLARLCGMPDSSSIMMLATEGLRVVPVTVHIPLKDVATTLTSNAIIQAGIVTAADLRDRFGIEKPRLAVAGLNPHAGEGGTIGMEESTHIMPAIWALRDQGIDVSDPQPADTLFHADARATYDAVLCMYHDQALVPLKTLDFWGGVNITLGLPIIRTSPDHGTAFNLAGQGIARTDSMLQAIRVAADMASKATP